VAIAVEDPRERNLPDAGWLELSDAESGQRVLVDTGNRRLRDRIRTLNDRRREERARILAATGVDSVTLSTDSDYAIPLRRAFALRAQRIRRG
jgi:uncharacterized protein (DUF58 family)